MKTTVDGFDFYASVHRDKKPMYLVHTAESMLEG
jgi:Transposase IS4